LQRSCRAHAKIGILGHVGDLDHTPDPAVGANPDRDLIAEINELKAGLQLVVSVGPTADNM
jgi:hypothetical protein